MSIYGGNPINVNENLTLSDIGYSRGDVLSATAELVWDESPLNSVVESIGLLQAKNLSGAERLSQNEALAEIGKQNLSIDIPEEGINRPALQILMNRERERIKRDHVFANRQDDPGFGAALQQLGVGLAVSVVDPLNIATALVPTLGIAKLAKMSDTVAGAVKAAPARTAIGEAVAGAALAEAIVLPAQNYLQSDYDLYDSLLNVGMGTFMAAGVQGIARAYNASAMARAERKLQIRSEMENGVQKVLTEVIEKGRTVRESVETIDRRPTDPTMELTDKFLNASTETKDAVFRALMMRAVQGKDLDIDAILNADINAFAGRQVFELEELETTLDNHFEDALGELRKLTDEQFLGKRKTQRNRKQIGELKESVEALYEKSSWVDYRAEARTKLGSGASKKAIRNLAESMQQRDQRKVLDQIAQLRERIETGRAAAPVKAALDRLQQRAEEYEVVKELVLRNARKLQEKINEHPETLKRLEQVRKDSLDPERTINLDPSRDRRVKEQLSKPDVDPDDLRAQSAAMDAELEALADELETRYPDEAGDALRAAQDEEIQSKRTAEIIRDSAACIAS